MVIKNVFRFFFSIFSKIYRMPTRYVFANQSGALVLFSNLRRVHNDKCTPRHKERVACLTCWSSNVPLRILTHYHIFLILLVHVDTTAPWRIKGYIYKNFLVILLYLVWHSLPSSWSNTHIRTYVPNRSCNTKEKLRLSPASCWLLAVVGWLSFAALHIYVLV